MELTWVDFAQVAVAAALIGFSKTGVPGLGILIVPLIAAVTGAKASTGVVLPMLLFADFFAVGYYRRHANWPVLLKLLPWVLAGMGGGFAVLAMAPEGMLDVGLGLLVVCLVILQLAKERSGGWFDEKMPRTWWFSAVMGFLAGFTTTVGNLAGSITAIYFLSMRLDKHSFMGTSAWFYLTVNALKVPLYSSLGLINVATLALNLKLALFVVAGAASGLVAFRIISQKWFNRAVMVLAVIAALKMVVPSKIFMTLGAWIKAMVAGSL